MSRMTIGRRRWLATIRRHDGTLDDYGQPTYDTPGDWDDLVTGWYCELQTTVGGEIIRGRQVHAKSTHVAYGDWSAVEGVTAADRLVINGVTYGINAGPLDVDGTRKDARIELRAEQ